MLQRYSDWGEAIDSSMTAQERQTLEAYRHVARLFALHGEDIPELAAVFERYERETARLREKEDLLNRARLAAGLVAAA